jgi:glycosyltransferase involved in cell wall biosynthesis
VVLPCHNEAAFIGHVVETLPAWVDHVLVIDDASTDETASAASALGDPRVRVTTMPRNVGVGGAIVEGYRRALALGVGLVLVSNGDGQMSGHEAGDLLLPLVEKRADLVKGNRLLCPGTRDTIPLGRKLGIHAFSVLTRVATRVDGLGDSQSGYHAITSEALRRLPLDQLWPRYGFPNDLLIKASHAGLRILQRPTRAIYGREVSGLRARHAVYPVGWLVLRGLLQR